MAMPTVELEIKLIKEQYLTEAKKEIETTWRLAARDRLKRELTAEENKRLLGEINKLFLGREQWLKQMRELRMRELQGAAYTPADEQRLNTTVNGLLKTNSEFISKYKYEPDAMSDSQAFSSDPSLTAIHGFFSKVIGIFGEGKLSFLGKLLEFLFGIIAKIMPMVTELGEKLNPPKKPESFLNEGNVDAADVELRKQEVALLTKMDNMLEDLKDQDLNRKLQPLLAGYRKAIEEFEKKDLLEHPDVSDLFKRDNLKARLDAFNIFSKETSGVLKMHEEEVALNTQINAATVQETEMNAKIRAMGIPPAPVTPESELLAQRVAVLHAEIQAQTAKRATIVANEKAVLYAFEAANNNFKGAFIAPLLDQKEALDDERVRVGLDEPGIL